jgi:hypothetical protein
VRTLLLQAILGLGFFLSGIQAMYFYISNLEKGASFLIMLLSFILIGAGGFLLMRAGKSDDSVFKRIKNFRKKSLATDEALEQTLKQNSALTSEWNKTIEKRDKLKMLEVSTAAAAEATQE